MSSKPGRDLRQPGTDVFVYQFDFKVAVFSLAIAALLLFFPLGAWRAILARPAIAPVVDLSLDQQHMVIRGDQANAYLSELTASADFNGDGFKDLLIGAAGRNSHGSFSGAAYMILGSANPLSVINLSTSQANLTILGASTNHALGHSVAGGDVNGDGFDDMIVAADGYNSNRGAVYVFLGGASLAGPQVIDLSLPGSAAALTITGKATGERLGRSVASGDINQDGFDDIIIGAYNASPGGRTEAGAVYVILGSSSISAAAPKTIPLQSQAAGLTILGAGGDPDGAGIASLGAPEAASPLFADELQPLATAEIGDRLGRSVAVGDLNGDGIADIIAGAYGANVGSNADAGITYVFYGSATYSDAAPQTIDLSTTAASLTLNGIDAGDQSGFFVMAGDVNKDGYADILTSAYISQGYNNAAASAGEAYVVYGSASLPASLDLATQVTIYGAAAGDRLGRSLASGDVNGDGYDDLILGASRADPPGRPDAGIVYVIYGGTSLPSPVLLSDPNNANVRILGAGGTGVTCDPEVMPETDCSDEAGHSSAVGDINGDGVEDVIVGALFANNGSLQDAGAAYVVFGGERGGRYLYLPAVTK